MEEDFKQLHDHVLRQDAAKAENWLRCMQNVFEQDYHETAIDEYILNAFDDQHGLIAFVAKTRNIKEFSNAIAESLEIMHVFVNRMTEKVAKYSPDICQMCVRVVVTNKPSSKTKTRAMELLAIVLQKTNFSNDQNIEDLYENLNNCYNTYLQEKSSGVLATVIKALYTLIRKYYEKLRSVDYLCKSILSRLAHNANRSERIAEIAESFRFFNNYLIVNKEYNEYRTLYCYVLRRLESECSFKTSHIAALEFLRNHANLYQEEIYNDSQKLERILMGYLNSAGEIQKASYYTLDVLYEKLSDTVTNKDDHRSCVDYLNKFINIIYDENKHGYELRLAIRGFGYFAKSIKKFCEPKNAVMTPFLNMILKIEKMYLLDFDRESEHLNYLPDYVQTLSKIIEQLDDVSHHEIAILQKTMILLIRLSPYLSAHHPDFVVNPILVAFSLVRKCQKNMSRNFLQNVITEGIIYSCSHTIAYDLVDTDVITYKNYMKLWITLVNKNVSDTTIPIEEAEKMLEEIYDELMRTLFSLISKLNLGIQKVEEHAAQSDPKFSLEAVKVPDFNIFVNMIDLYVELLKQAPKAKFSKCVKKYLDFTVNESEKYPLVSGFYKLIAVGLEICNSLNYFSPERLQRNDIKLYYERIDKFINSILMKIEVYKEDLKLSCIKIVIAAPEIYVQKNLKRLSPAIRSLFISSRSNLTLAMSGIDVLESWCEFLPQQEYDEFLMEVVPTLDSYLRSKALSESIDTSSTKQRKRKQAIYRRNIARVSEGDLLQLQKKILSFLGHVNGNVCRSLTEVNNSIEQVPIGENLSMKVDLNYDLKITIYLEKLLPRIVHLALYCSERKLQITACEALHAMVIIFLGTSRVQDKKELDNQMKKMFYPLLQLGCFPDNTVRQLIKPLLNQLIHWYSSPTQRNSSQLAIVIESLLEAVTQREDTSLRDFACQCIHELVEYSLKHSDAEYTNVKVVIRKIRQFCYHSDPVKRLAGSLIFNNTYTLLREERFIIDVYWLDLFQSLIYNLSQVEERDEYDSLLHIIQSIDHLERVFKEKASIFNQSSNKRKIPNGFLDGTLNSVITTALNYRCAKNRQAKARIYQFFYNVSPFTPDKSNKLTFPPYIISDLMTRSFGDTKLSLSDVIIFLKKLLHVLDTELSVYEHEQQKHCYALDEKLYNNLQNYFEKIHPFTLKTINITHKSNYTDFDNITFKNLKFELSKCAVQYLTISSFYEDDVKIHRLMEKYGLKLLLDFLFGCTDNIEELDEQISLNLLMKISASKYVASLIMQINEYISKNYAIVDDLENNVSRRQKQLLRGMKIITKSSFNEKININLYLKDILENVLNKLISPVTNYTIKLTDDIKIYCQSVIDLSVHQKDIGTLLKYISNNNEIHDVEKNKVITFGVYLYNTFKDALLPILINNIGVFLNLLNLQDDIYFFTKEIVNYIRSNRKKIDSRLITNVINTILSNWSMYKRYYVKKLNTITEGLQLLESISDLSDGTETLISDDTVTWVLSCFEFSMFRILPQHLYKHTEQILSALPMILKNRDFTLFKAALDMIKNNYFIEIVPELQDSATIVINKSFQTSIMSKSVELFIFSCNIYISSKLRKDVNVEEYNKMFMIAISKELQYETLKSSYQNVLFKFTENALQLADLIISNLLRYATYEIFERFYTEFIKDILDLLKKPDDNKENVIGKCIGFILVKCLFSRINTDNFEDKTCPITKMAYTVTSGSELVKNLFMISVNYLKDNTSDESSELTEWIRICKCHSYNALISVISNGVRNHFPNYTRYYDKLFYREANGENVLWKNLIDLSKCYHFPLIFDKLPAKTTRLVNIRTHNQGFSDIHYIESQTLYESTLSEDFRKYDFTKTIIRSQESNSYTSNRTEVEMQIVLEGDEITSHECMANICGLIKQIHDDKIYEEDPSPKWIEYINNDLKNEKTHINVKLFLLKIIEKEQDIFKPYSNLLLETLIDLIINKVSGNEINYFVGDLIIMLTSWGNTEGTNIENPTNISKLVLFLLENTNRERHDVKKYHLNLLKLVVESWRQYTEIPADYILSELEKLEKSKKVELVVHFCSIFLANDLEPWGNNLKKFATKLVRCLQSDSTVVQRTCSETIGMALKLLEKRLDPEFEPFHNAVINKVKAFDLGRYLTCLQGFIKSYPKICDHLLSKIVDNFCKTPASKRVGLYVFSERIEALHEHPSFPLMKFEKLINDYDDELKVLGMDIIRKSLPKVQIDQKENPNARIKFSKTDFKSLMGIIAKFSNNNNRVCRSAMYDVFIGIYNNIDDKDIVKIASDVLLSGLTDPEEEIQMKLIEFLFNELPNNNISSKFVSVLKEFYKPELEDHFLGYATKFLLKGLDTSAVLFDAPLQKSNFSERLITDNWRGRHSSYAPLFASTYQSQDSNSFNTQGTGSNSKFHSSMGNLNLRATAMEMEFEPTYQPGTIGFEKQEMLESMGDEEEELFKVPLAVVDRKMYKRRFQKDTSKMERQIALRQLSKREKTAQERLDNVKQRQEKATIYRKYRDGEIPDIEICLADLITPLNQLIQHDAHLAEVFYTSFFHEILRQCDDKQSFLKEIGKILTNIFKSSTLYNSFFMSALLNVVVKIPDQAFSPTTIATVASSSGLLSSGILVLEEFLIPELYENAQNPVKRNPASNPQLKVWVKLADLYRELQDWDTVKAIFLEKMDCKEGVLEAINYESQGQWWEAEGCYLQLIQQDASLDRKDFYYESYFKCFAEMSKWQQMSTAIRSVTSDNVWAELWDKDWNQQKLLPWYISAELKNSVEDPNKMKEFTDVLNTAMMDSEKIAHLKQYFSEEIAFLHLTNSNLDKALYYLKNNLEKFLEDWQNTSPMLVSLRTNKLMKIMNSVDMFNFINKINVIDPAVLETNALKLGKQWQRVTYENASSIVPIEARHFYRINCLNALQDKLTGDTWDKIKFDMNLPLLEIAVSMKNYHVAKKCIEHIKNNYEQEENNVQVQLAFTKTLMLRTTYLPADSERLFQYVEESYRVIDKYLGESSSEPVKLKLTNALYDILFDFSRRAYRFETQVSQLIPDLTNCSENGVKEYVATKMRNILDTCVAVPSSSLPLIADSYMKLTLFYKSFPQHSDQLIRSILRAMYYGSQEGRQMFPCLLDIKDVGVKYKAIFLEELKNLPEWLFIQWIPQLLSKLDSDCIFIIDNIVLKLAESYPQSIMYAYKLSKEKYSMSINDINIKNHLDTTMQKLDQLLANETADDLIEALSCVASANNVVIFHIANLSRACLLNDANLFKTYMENLNAFCKKVNTDDPSSKIGHVHKRILELSKEVLKLQKEQFNAHKLFEKLDNLRRIVKSSQDSGKRLSKFQLKLSYYSPYLEYFTDNQLDDSIELEIPGQYKGDTKPLPQYHVKIAGFSPEVVLMQSIRKPIRIKIIGNDGKDHPFLVKVGEDLRQDQRIEQIFSLMNNIFNSNAACRERRLKISTYQVVPLNTNLGLIEWVENSKPLHDFLVENTPIGAKKLDTIRQRHIIRYSKPFSSDYHKALSKHKPEIVASIFQELVNMVPHDIFRQALRTLSVNSESFISIRNTFITSYVSTCIANWVLGIGDRHLSNTLVCLENARSVDIDFGHAFGSGVQIQSIPELVPFRLTPHIINLMQPLGEHGLIEQTMIHVLRALRQNQSSLLSTVKVFINEPSMDWVQYKKFKNQDMGYNWCAEEKIRHTEMKLSGGNSAEIMIEELRKKTIDTEYIEKYVECVRGTEKNIRSKLTGMLSVEDQVKCLLDHATDPNLLCRMFYGWNAWV